MSDSYSTSVTHPTYSSGSSTGSSSNSSSNQSQNTASNESQSTGSSSSASYIPEYSQTPILTEIANYSRGLAPQAYQWGMDQFNNSKGDIDSLMRDSLSYASPQRIKASMGMAEAGVQQGAEAGRQSTLRDLQSFGIDPSSGRYAALDNASRVTSAAAAAGAGNQQRMADFAQGNTMRNQAIAAGNQNVQTGYGAINASNALLGTAMSLKYPPLGNTSTSANQSTSAGRSQGTSEGSSQGSSSNQSSNVGGGGGGHSESQTQSGGGGGGSRGGGGSGGGGSGGGGSGGSGSGSSGDSGTWRPGDGSPVVLGGGEPYGPTYPGYGEPYGPTYPGYGEPYGPTYPGSGEEYGPTYPGDGNSAGGGGGDFASVLYNSLSGFRDLLDSGGGGDGGGGGDYGVLGGPVEHNYAVGGAVSNEATTGGFVSHDMSPSGGAQTDDVQANLNAGEFVIPKDVAAWKGQEFFYKLMAQARKTRMMAGSGGEAGSAPPSSRTGYAVGGPIMANDGDERRPFPDDEAQVTPVLFAGEHSQTADRPALAQAKTMLKQGFELDDIGRRTGWDVGPNRRWMYEIPDDQSRINMDAVPKTAARPGQSPLSGPTVPARDVLVHPALQAAYPKMFNSMRVGRVSDPRDYGMYDPDANALTLGQPRDAPKEDPRRIVLHELTHGIQAQEDFQPGGGPELFKQKGKSTPFDQYFRLKGEAEARNVADRMNLTPEERVGKRWWETSDVQLKDQINHPYYRHGKNPTWDRLTKD